MLITMIGHKGLPARSGGIERHVEELSASLTSLGARVLSFDRKWYVGDANPLPGVLRRFSYGIHTKHLDAITHTVTAIFLARKDHPDVIHIHGVGPALVAPLARIVHPRARIIVTFHCVDRLHKKWGRFARFALGLGERVACLFAHQTITVSESLAAYCLSTYHAQTTCIPNGVRVSHEEILSPLEKFRLSPDGYFAMISRLIPHKNIHVAVEAHMLLAERRKDLAESYPLVIVGDASFTDEYARELGAMIMSYPHAIMLGERHGDELKSLQAHALAHLSVSSSEGMSISLLEAMAMRRPLIVSDIPENVEVTGLDALVVRVNDAQSLSRAMENLLEMKSEERSQMGEALLDRVQSRHDWDNIARETLGVYERLAVGVEAAERLVNQSMSR